MAEKDTKRERREQLKRQRMEAARRAKRKQQQRRLYWGIAAVLVIALIVFLVLNSGKKKGNLIAKVNTAAAAAGCGEVKTFPVEGRNHVQNEPPYKTNPPTSGDHFASTAKTGVHTAAIPLGNEVHNLEHGHVGIQYTDALPANVRSALEDFTRDNDLWVFMAPLPTLPAGTSLAFSAWTHSVSCTAPTDPGKTAAAAKAFLDAYQNQGPEKNAPGVPQ